MNFTPAGPNGLVDCFLLVKSSDKKTSSKGDAYLDMLLSDKSGEINAKLWSYVPAVHGEYETGDIVKVRGTVSQYNGNPQLRIEKIRLAFPEDGVDPADFVAASDYSGEAMWQELYNIAEGFSDGDLRAIVTTLLSENKEKLLFWPAAFKLHHAIRSGLMMHTLSIVKLCERVSEIYPFVDRELLISGAILHDIAKTTEYDVSSTGLATGYSVKGNLIGHLAEGAIMINKTAEKLGIESETVTLLEHMVLSHHGEPEFGAAVRPMFIEAELLSELDMMDARIYEMREATADTAKGEFSGRMWSMDNRKLYNHGRDDMDKKVRLF
ncbi:MAG: HD domain-containing protein [Clostridia bacterium]|nr:HD domain-containing protein [Clostridia bacterium]